MLVFDITYVNNSVSIYQPHNSRPGVSSNTAAESGTIAFFNSDRLRFTHESGRGSNFFNFAILFGNTVTNGLKQLKYKLQLYNY